MAKMVPSQYNPDTTSYGEQEIFHALEKLPKTYTVFHSMALNSHAGKLFAEIDFVLLCPQGVLCLEVKGGRIKCHERQWLTYGGDNETREIQNPFTQAQSAAMALHSDVRDYFRTNRNVTNACFASGVAFPDITFTERGPEVRPEIVYDKRSGDLTEYIERVFAYWSREFRERNKYELTGLSGPARKQLERYLYNNFDIVYTVGTKVHQVEQETIRLTEEQKRVLNYVSNNQRILMTGGAGTGKTILCLEQAQRLARSSNVLFLCFNHNLSFHLQHRVRVQSPELADSALQVYAFYKYLVQVLREHRNLPPKPSPEDKEAVNRYWQEDIPRAFLQLTEHDLHSQFDVLIIDEGQDLLNPLTLQCLDKLVKGGLQTGRWLVALDPEQNIYRTDLESGIEYLKQGAPSTASRA